MLTRKTNIGNKPLVSSPKPEQIIKDRQRRFRQTRRNRRRIERKKNNNSENTIVEYSRYENFDSYPPPRQVDIQRRRNRGRRKY